MRTMRLAMVCGVCLLTGAGLLLADAKAAELKIGLMPAYNSIPLVVAKAGSMFEARGVSVALVPFNGQLLPSLRGTSRFWDRPELLGLPS